MFRSLASFQKYLFSPMLLSDFGDYDTYWEKRVTEGRMPSTQRAAAVSRYIESGASILDIGCGDGVAMQYFAGHNSPKHIAGVDISQKMVDALQSRGFEVHRFDITSADFVTFMKDRRFDYIIVTQVLEHIQEAEAVMRAVKDSFDKSLIVSIPNAGFLPHRIRLLFGRFPSVEIIYHVKEHIRFWTHRDFLYWCGHLGFRVSRFSPCLSYRALGIDFGKVLPSLCGIQMIYDLKVKE